MQPIAKYRLLNTMLYTRISELPRLLESYCDLWLPQSSREVKKSQNGSCDNKMENPSLFLKTYCIFVCKKVWGFDYTVILTFWLFKKYSPPSYFWLNENLFSQPNPLNHFLLTNFIDPLHLQVILSIKSGFPS